MIGVPVTDHDPFDRMNGDFQSLNIANYSLRVGPSVEQDSLRTLTFDLGGLRARGFNDTSRGKLRHVLKSWFAHYQSREAMCTAAVVLKIHDGYACFLINGRGVSKLLSDLMRKSWRKLRHPVHLI